MSLMLEIIRDFSLFGCQGASPLVQPTAGWAWGSAKSVRKVDVAREPVNAYLCHYLAQYGEQ